MCNTTFIKNGDFHSRTFKFPKVSLHYNMIQIINAKPNTILDKIHTHALYGYTIITV